MNITFTTINYGSRASVPYVKATVDGVSVRHVDRSPEYIGWRCDEHGDEQCWHAEALMPLLARRIRDWVAQS